MENVPYHDVEFYSTTPPSIHHHHSSHHVTSRGWKDYAGHQYQSNNNHLSAPVQGSGAELESSFSINVTTGDSEMFIDDLIELAADGTNNDSSSVRSSSAASSVISTPSPVIVPSLAPKTSSMFQDERNLVRSAPPPQIYHSRLHEALTQPRLPTAPVKCHRCGNELTSRCLMQTCADDTRCRQCGRDLTAKCILAVCTVQQGSKVDQDDHLKKPTPSVRRHHYSSPSN